MWFAWALHLEAAQVLASDGPRRALMMAGGRDGQCRQLCLATASQDPAPIPARRRDGRSFEDIGAALGR